MPIRTDRGTGFAHFFEIHLKEDNIVARETRSLSQNALVVLRERYLLKDAHRRVIETPAQMFQRVARAVALGDAVYGPEADVAATAGEFYELMANLEFLPNSPTLMNAGTPLGQLMACFV